MPSCRWLTNARASIGSGLFLIPGLSHAHSVVKGAGDFYAGVLHPLTSLEHVLTFVALGLLAGQQGKKSELVLPVFGVALVTGATASLWIALRYGGLLNIVSAVLFGSLLALAWPLSPVVFYGMAVLFGLSHGYANGSAMSEGIKPYLFVPGVGLAGLAVSAYCMMISDYLLRRKANWIHIAVRVAGSWIAAIGLLAIAIGGKTFLKS